MSEPLTLPPCRVCGGTATGIHYGVNTCEACKAFFRRSLVEKNKYVCPREGDCKIINHKRANCSACRLKKCLDLGMSKKAVRHGRYTVAIRTKTILEVKQLEREQALKDSFAFVDSIAKKLPEIISVPENTPEPESSVNNSNLSSNLESSDISSLVDSVSIDSLQSTTIDSSQQHTELSQPVIGPNSLADPMTSLEPSSMFSSMEQKISNEMFTRMDSFDILNAIDLDIRHEDILEISGSDVFLNGPTAPNVDIDLTSDQIDFLEINPDDFINLSQDIEVPAPKSCNEAQVEHTNSLPQKDVSEVQQYSPDTTTLDESGSSQSGSLMSVDFAASPTSSSSSTVDNQPPSSKSVQSYSQPPQKKLRSSYNMVHDMEQLQMINTLVTAQEILYPEMRKYFNKEYTEVIHREFMEKTQLQTELFGHLKSLSTAEYNNFFLVTGMDVDGRIDMFTKVAEIMQKEIVRYISFVKSIPGWEEIHNSDKLTLIKASRFEYWLLGKYLMINPEMGITVSEKCAFTHKQICQMWGSPENIDTINSFTRKIKKLELTFEEIAMLRGIVVLSRDRCILRQPELVEKMQWNILQSFIHLLKKTHPNEPLRFARCMDKLTQLRELTEINYKANKNLENFQKSLIQNYPLLYECVTYEG